MPPNERQLITGSAKIVPMYKTSFNQQGGYRFAEGVFQYSAGVCAEPGYRIERARFARPLQLTNQSLI
jgi:hypothetical protein